MTNLSRLVDCACAVIAQSGAAPNTEGLPRRPILSGTGGRNPDLTPPWTHVHRTADRVPPNPKRTEPRAYRTTIADLLQEEALSSMSAVHSC
jgi:hypothetical protein